MAVEHLSASTQDYLKCVWTLQEWSGEPVTITALAERLGVRTSSASDGIKKLAEQGLVHHETYGGVTLTEAGRAHAVAMVRRHRLLETYLVQELGYDWDEVHDEAEVLEHAVSDRLIAAIDARLGHPTRDPHGDPIPSADGAAHLPDAVVLSRAEPGRYVVTRISDADPARLRAFAEAGVMPDAVLTVASDGRVAAPQGGLELDDESASAIWVVRA
ncbi:MAG: metal-dependent transcriptional regulator [Actinomycetes bacterium]|nr:MAG: metal-dependent transcriptional regulator [Actinomycetota bacterium]